MLVIKEHLVSQHLVKLYTGRGEEHGGMGGTRYRNVNSGPAQDMVFLF